MLKFIVGIIVGVTVTVIGWDVAAQAIIDLVQQIIAIVR